jgi:ribokinase
LDSPHRRTFLDRRNSEFISVSDLLIVWVTRPKHRVTNTIGLLSSFARRRPAFGLEGTVPEERPIVVVGSINIDLVAVADRIPAVGETVLGTDFQIHPGGKGANQAVAIARLGHPVQMIGRLGNDSFGTQLRTNMQAVGVDCSGVATCEGPSGVAVILVSNRGENCIVVAPGANAKVTPRDVESSLPIIRRAGMVLTQLEIPMETVECLRTLCRREGIPLILDPAPAHELPPGVFQSLEWFTPNQTEAAFYAGTRDGAMGTTSPEDAARILLSKGCRGVLLKLGSRGAYLATSQHSGQFVSAFRVTAVDSTAAGDAFNGAFATGLARGKSPRESAIFAAAAAAISVTRAGAQTSMPTMPEVQHFLRDHVI